MQAMWMQWYVVETYMYTSVVDLGMDKRPPPLTILVKYKYIYSNNNQNTCTFISRLLCMYFVFVCPVKCTLSNNRPTILILALLIRKLGLNVIIFNWLKAGMHL